MRNWVRAFRGIVPVRVRGAQPERVLNLCAENGVACLRPQPVEDCVLRFWVYADAADAVERFALRCGCVAERGRERGVPHLRRVLKRRRFALWLLAITTGLLMLSSMFIWEIWITGNETVPTGRILRALEESGFSIGTCWLKFRTEQIQNGLLLRMPELEWASFTIRGSRAEFTVYEATDAPEIIDEDVPTALIASHDGIIVRMTVLNGQPMVQRGEAVAAGQVLVSGWAADLQGQVRGVRALGSVRARTYWELTAAQPLQTRQKSPDGRAGTRWALRIGKKRFNFYKNSGILTPDCDTIYQETALAVPGVFRLPVSVLKETAQPYRTEPTALSEDAAAQLEQLLLQTLTARIGPDGELLDPRFTTAERDGLLLVTLRAECEQDIAYPQIQEEFPQYDRTDDTGGSD